MIENTLNSEKVYLADESLIVKTYQWVLASLVSSFLAVILGYQMFDTINAISLPLYIVAIGSMIALYFTANKRPLNAIILFIMTFSLGLVLSTKIYLINTLLSNGTEIIISAGLLTIGAVTSLTLYAANTKRDFSAIRGFLFVALIVYLLAALLNAFWLNAFWLQLPFLQMLLSATGVVLFSLYLVMDTQSLLKREYGNQDPIFYAVSIYIDIFNLFVSLLSLITSLFGEKN